MAISVHEIRIIRAFEQHADRWLSHHELADLSDVAPRTVRQYTKRLVEAGLVTVRDTFPGHRYHWRTEAVDTPHYAVVQQAREALALEA